MQKLTNSIRSLCGKQTAPDSTVYLIVQKAGLHATGFISEILYSKLRKIRPDFLLWPPF